MKAFPKRLRAVIALATLVTPAMLCAASNPFTIVTVASTVPPNSDLNPYGVAIVPITSGNLTAGHNLVSNFNNSANLQGTGTTS